MFATLHISPDIPYLPALARQLLKSTETPADKPAPSALPPDLRATLAIVPTRRSARRLRETLAIEAAQKNTGLLPPQTLTPDQLLDHALPENLASTPDILAAWTQILLGIDLETIRDFLPNDPPKRDHIWALQLARQLHQLQITLAPESHTFASVARKTAGTDYEPERWDALARLETLWLEHLENQNLQSPHAARQAAARTAAPPAGITRIILANTPDIPPLARTVLDRWSQQIPVTLILHADPENAPAPKNPPLPLSQIPLHLNTEAMARQAAAIAANYTPADYLAQLAIAVTDPLETPFIKNALAQAGRAAHDPAGIPLARTSAGKLTLALAKLAIGDDTDSILALFRHPQFAAYAIGKKLISSQARLLAQIDELRNEHLAETLPQLLAFAPAHLRDILRRLEKLRTQFARDFHATLLNALGETLADKILDPENPGDALEKSALEKLRDLLSASEASEHRHPRLPADLWARLLENTLAQTPLFPPRPDNAIDLQGWYELPFETAPDLLILGLNEGRVPEHIHGDPFLPETLRRHLGMATNEDRAKRDQHILETLARSRSKNGNLQIHLLKTNSNGDPLLPSRLLFDTDDATLLERAQALFRTPEQQATPPRSVPWLLTPPDKEISLPKRHSPSSLAAYLACPYRYYLERILKMGAVETGKDEIDGGEYGTLIHETLQQLPHDHPDTTDEKTLADYLNQRLDQIIEQQYGATLTLPLRIQRESARARLQALVPIEASRRRDGWRTLATEHAWQFLRGKHTFIGYIDRIDAHPDGRLQLIDYKTSDDPDKNDPDKIHFASWPKNDPPHIFPESRIPGEDTADTRWTNLQLPLYLLALRTIELDKLPLAQKHGLPLSTFDRTAATAVYFTLPKIKERTNIYAFKTRPLTPGLLASAEQCAVAIADAIEARRFWPPGTDSKYGSPFDYLFPDGILKNATDPFPSEKTHASTQ